MDGGCCVVDCGGLGSEGKRSYGEEEGGYGQDCCFHIGISLARLCGDAVKGATARVKANLGAKAHFFFRSYETQG